MCTHGIHIDTSAYGSGEKPQPDDIVADSHGNTATVLDVQDDGTLLVVWDDDEDPHEDPENPMAFRLLERRASRCPVPPGFEL